MLKRRKNGKRVCFVGLQDETNFGDPILAHCTEWLFGQYITDADRVESYSVSIGPVERVTYDYTLLPWTRRKLSGLFYRLRCREKANAVVCDNMEQLIEQYYEAHIGRPDLIVVVGGGLVKFRVQKFWRTVSALLRYAQRKNIPVVMSAVGVEGYDAAYFKCQRLKRALHRPSLKYVSTRDDIATLHDCYFDGRPKIPCLKVADPAVWAAEAFGVLRDTTSKVIGLGIARSAIFERYDVNLTDTQAVALYVEVAKTLRERGYQLELFTNGLEADNETARQVKDIVDASGLKLFIPQSPRELVEHIAGYRGIIATRLHSCIVAYSLGIPAVGIVWNDKLPLFGQNIGRPGNFVSADHFQADYILSTFEQALHAGYDETIRTAFRETIRESIKDIYHQFIKQ